MPEKFSQAFHAAAAKNVGLKVVTATFADIPETKSPTEVRLP
jgi:hypothetical protein